MAAGVHPAVEDFLWCALTCGDVFGNPAIRCVARVDDTLAHSSAAWSGMRKEVLGGHLFGVGLGRGVEIIVECER